MKSEILDAAKAEALANLAVGNVYERAPMLCADGTRFQITGRRDHTRIVITRVPGGRRRVIRYRKVDPKPMGNGRADRGEHTLSEPALVRHYALVKAATPRAKGDSA